MSKIVLVDDVYAELQLIEGILKSANHTVFSYMTADKLEEKLVSVKPDLVIGPGRVGAPFPLGVPGVASLGKVPRPNPRASQSCLADGMAQHRDVPTRHGQDAPCPDRQHQPEKQRRSHHFRSSESPVPPPAEGIRAAAASR